MEELVEDLEELVAPRGTTLPRDEGSASPRRRATPSRGTTLPRESKPRGPPKRDAPVGRLSHGTRLLDEHAASSCCPWDDSPTGGSMLAPVGTTLPRQETPRRGPPRASCAHGATLPRCAEELHPMGRLSLGRCSLAAARSPLVAATGRRQRPVGRLSRGGPVTLLGLLRRRAAVAFLRRSLSREGDCTVASFFGRERLRKRSEALRSCTVSRAASVSRAKSAARPAFLPMPDLDGAPSSPVPPRRGRSRGQIPGRARPRQRRDGGRPRGHAPRRSKRRSPSSSFCRTSPRPDAVERFLREARAAIKIRSEHVARVLDVGRLESGAPYMVMEYLEGSDLARVSRARATARRHRGRLRAPGLRGARGGARPRHRPRDLKPANLFLTSARAAPPSSRCSTSESPRSPAPTPKARANRARLTTTTAILGTPSYMSPEQMRSTRDVDARSDVWSSGPSSTPCSRASAVPGRVHRGPVREDHPRPASSPGRHPPDAPEALSYAMARCLEKAPDRRFRTVGELSAAIVEYGSAEARASLTRRSWTCSAPATGKPSRRSRRLDAVRETTGPARVVISYPPNKSAGGLGRAPARRARGKKRTTPATCRVRPPSASSARRPSSQSSSSEGIEAIVGGAIALQAYRNRAPATPSATAIASSPAAPSTGATAAARANVQAASTGWETAGCGFRRQRVAERDADRRHPRHLVVGPAAGPDRSASGDRRRARPLFARRGHPAAAVGSAPTGTAPPKSTKGPPLQLEEVTMKGRACIALAGSPSSSRAPHPRMTRSRRTRSSTKRAS